MMPKTEHFTLIMKALDIRITDQVVVYDCRKNWFANRAVFMLKAFGIDNAKVLDGGFAKWRAEGKPVVSNSRGPATDADFDFKLNESSLIDFKAVKSLSD